MTAAMHIVVLVILIPLVLIAPSVWARATLRRNAMIRKDIPGTGGELARHLVKRFEVSGVAVEATPGGDHYDPLARAIRLSPAVMENRSLTAVASAAHEFGHALQHASGYRPLIWRTALVRFAATGERLGSLLFVTAPVLGALTRSPQVTLALLLVALVMMSMTVVVHLVTLPVEFDASFGKAMPILEAGNYVSGEDLAEVRRILRACALTYVAASLASLLSLGRWLTVFIRR